MGLPVVTVAAGGLPVVEATLGTPVTEASNGRGVAVTKVVGKPGLPVRFETIGSGGGALAPPLDGIVGATVTGSWSFSRDMLTTFGGGSKYTTISGNVQVLNDQSGNARHFADNATAGVRPPIAIAGPNSRDAGDFVGDRWLSTNGFTAANFFTVSTGYLAIGFIIDTITATNSDPFQNHPLFSDSSAFLGMFVKNTGTPASVIAANYPGALTTATKIGINVGTVYVCEWWHAGGNLFVNINNGTPVSAVSGNTSNMNNLLRIGWGWNSSAVMFDGKIFELFTASAVPTNRAAIVTNMMTYIGAT